MDRPVAAFLRGINIGGHHKVAMSALRDLLADLGYSGARTHLQSGNAVFNCGKKEPEDVGGELEDAIERNFGFRCRVIIRDRQELEQAISADPLAQVATDPARHLIGFLDRTPSPEHVRAAEERSSGDDLVRVIGNHLYVWCPTGISASSLFKVEFDRLLSAAVTLRNWNTVTRMSALLREA